jgi:hypothetical protein
VTGITVWWDGIPGLDPRVPFGDAVFADRIAALACATRTCGTDPSGTDTAALRQAANVADKFLDHFQEAESDRDGYIRRLTLAIACTGTTGKPKDPLMPPQVIRVAERYRKYLTQPADKRGGWI